MAEVEVLLDMDQDGNIAFGVKEGTFEDGSKAIEKVGSALGVASGKFNFEGKIERHTHGPDVQKVLRSSQIKA